MKRCTSKLTVETRTERGKQKTNYEALHSAVIEINEK